MSLLVLGLSHHGAPIELLEAAALDTPSRGRLESAIVGSEHVVEAVVVSTCNRTEVYAEGVTFHGSLTAVSESLAALASSVAWTHDPYQRPKNTLISLGRPRYSTLRAMPSHWMTLLLRASQMRDVSPKYIQ